jgi:uncharacterized membrane protein YccC
METPDFQNRIVEFADRESLRPDFSRAARGMVAAMVPLLLGLSGHLPVESAYAVLVGINIATVDVRGAYALRFTLLLTMAIILSVSAGLGGLVASSAIAAMFAMGLIALAAGVWRHLSSDYGPTLGIASTLVFALGIHGTGGPAVGVSHLEAAFAGGLWGLLLQVVLWPFRSEHPLRRTVADTWLALASVFEAMKLEDAPERAPVYGRIFEAESAFRSVTDHTAGVLSAKAGAKGPLVGNLIALNLAAGRLATQAAALNTVFETLAQGPDFARVAPSFQPVFVALVNTSRTVALAVVSRQPRHLNTLDIRVRRLKNLLGVLTERVPARIGASPETARLGDIIALLVADLSSVEASLRLVVDRARERQAFSLELFEMDTWKLKALGASIDLNLNLDPSLVRYSLRSAVLTMAAVLALMELHLRHGYWLPFTMMVVLQPDFGSTRQKAAQRMLGTIVGSVLASAVLFLHMPTWVLLVATALTAFMFNYHLKRSYGVAVVYITLFIVLLTETGGQVDLSFTIERLSTTLAGGLLALLGAFLFWPSWERDRFPPILAKAFRANMGYLRVLLAHLHGGRPIGDDVAHARRLAEAANSGVFSSLRRLSGDPKNRQDMLDRAAALANGNQRLTRALNGVTLRMEPCPSLVGSSFIAEFGVHAGESLEALALSAERGQADRQGLDTLRRQLDLMKPDLAAVGIPEDERRRVAWIIAQLGRASTELGAMLLA